MPPSRPATATAAAPAESASSATSRLSRRGLIARVVAAAVVGATLLAGSIAGTDDWWPFGPMTQYASAVPRTSDVFFTRVSARTTAGTTVDVPLNIEGAGVARAEIEARIPQIVADPALLQDVATGWAAKHPDWPCYTKLWLIRDTTHIVDGRVSGPKTSQVLATWTVR